MTNLQLLDKQLDLLTQEQQLEMKLKDLFEKTRVAKKYLKRVQKELRNLGE